MLSPDLSNVRIDFSNELFSENISKQFDDYLFTSNRVEKNIKSLLLSTISNLTIPGLQLSPVIVTGMNNSGTGITTGSKLKLRGSSTVNRTYPGTSPQAEIYDNNVIALTFRNVILNWMYLYNVFYGYYSRERIMDTFSIYITLLQTDNIPLCNIIFSDCFISSIPGMDFAFNNNTFRDLKTIDCNITFNKMDIDFSIPEFNLEKVNL